MPNVIAATSTKTMVANITASMVRADAECYRLGRSWYPDTNDLIRAMARESGLSTDHVAAIMAVLSPRSAWGTNVVNTAATIVEAGLVKPIYMLAILAAHGYRPADRSERLRSPRGLPLSISKARALVNGADIATVLNGAQKTGAFWSNLANPTTSMDVTVDAWAAGVALGRRLGNAEMAGLNKSQYKRIVEAYRVVARELDMLPSEVQAITWCEMRGRIR